MGHLCLKKDSIDWNNPRYLNCHESYQSNDEQNAGCFPKSSNNKNWKDQLIISCNNLMSDYN